MFQLCLDKLKLRCILVMFKIHQMPCPGIQVIELFTLTVFIPFLNFTQRLDK